MSLTHAVVGCSDLDTSATFFAALGFTETESERVPADLAATLYGIRGPVETLAMLAPGSRVGWIRLVDAEGPPRVWRPYMTGPVLLELYVRSITEAVALAQTAGARLAGKTAYTGSKAQRLREVRLIGPDAIGIGLTESTEPRKSLVDAGREFSELYSTLWIVESVAEALPGYPEFEVFGDFAEEDYEPVAEFLDLPDASAAIRTVYLGDPGAPLERLQLLEFSRRMAERGPAGSPIRPGIFAVGCIAAVDGPVGIDRPGGVRLEVWPAHSSN